jgi:hypothetical protein
VIQSNCEFVRTSEATVGIEDFESFIFVKGI